MKSEKEILLDAAAIAKDAMEAYRDGKETNLEHVATVWWSFCEDYDPYTEHASIDDNMAMLANDTNACIQDIEQVVADINDMFEE